MNKLTKLLENLKEEDLKLIKKDLKAGHIERLINKKLQEKIEADMNKVCPVCHTPTGEESLILVFGPKGLRKKASFCALDCLEYFLNMIKKERNL
ncbi:hypothetical protein AYK26_06515 [Euryarchaeota archaeon SM23-78]|nr:MAG: hypothetical protein AYK26_06515 [Euryarchaeota archaeon SM23-78]MBW3000599.1 hypothetical protein [Candidatus Woesearchaeota archaeon]